MVEGDDGRRDSAAEAPELTREPLDGVPPSRRRWPARRALNLASALAALALAIFLIAGGIVRLPGGPSHGIRATPTPAPAQISADAAATVAARDAGNGWLAAGPPEAQTIAFAPSDPATAYTCGVSPTVPAGGSGPIVVEVSYDGGTTWERRPVPATDQACWLSVDPLDAADVALEVTAAPSQPGAPAPTTLYRSFDGGASWAPFAPPPRSTGDLGAIGYYQMAWSGGALFVAPYYIGENGSTRVAVGRGGALAWLDVTALFADTADGASINRLFSTSGSLYVEVNRNVRDCLSDCFKVWRSRDGGATWAAIAPRIAGSEVQVLDAQPDRPVLFGQYDVAADGNSRTYARSEDDGATWTPLPPLPQGLVASSLVTTPLGYTYAAAWSFGSVPTGVPLGIYALRHASDRAWSFLAPYPHGFGGPIVSWDAGGAPLWLWGNATQPTDQGPAAGLERHAA